jgi:outer membrane protein assembly factor BamB
MKKILRYLKNNVLFLGIVSILIISCEEKQSTPNDWPQFKKDNFRSANSSVQLDLATLGEDWVYTSSQLPVPAWDGSAKEDTYANSGPLPSMRDYDLSYYPIVVDHKLYYGSSSDNAIHCLDTKTGEELWTYTSGGPIRVAPTYHSGKLYFGSDDGYAYCIKASNGKLVWKYSPTENEDKKVMNNNSLISFWPVRTGILVEDGIGYFGASMLPWKDSYFCALNIETGKPDIKGTYIKKYENLTLEGAMASTGTKIIQPQGRISPMFFNKVDGESQGQLGAAGGCFVLVTPERNIIHPNNTRADEITETIGESANPYTVDDKNKADFMSFKGGKELVVKGNVSYILTDNSISAYNRKSKKIIWLKRNYNAYRIIVSGDALYVGGTDVVYAVSTKNGYPLWKAPVKGTVYALAVADNALFASTGEGNIYCFRSGKKENTLYAENKDRPGVVDNEVKKEIKQDIGDLEFAAGPFISALGPNSIEINFVTDAPLQASVYWGNDFGNQVIKEKKANTTHKIIVNNIRKDFTYRYQIKAGEKKTSFFEFDNFFNYTEQIKGTNKGHKKSEFISEMTVLNASQKGIGIVFGTENEKLALEIAEQTPLKVMVFETSESKVNELRNKWQQTGFYGGKITIYHVKDYTKLPITGDVANIVVVNDVSESTSDEVIRLVKPKGYAILNNQKKDFSNWLANSKSNWEVSQTKKNNFIILKKAPLETGGKWTHQYGLANNSAFGGESLWGSTSTDDFEIQWMGRPGPRFQTDRSGRKPSPLVVNGKMFVQGRERVIAVDAYNGTVFWSKEIPGMIRMNIPRDCSNWVADDDFIYIAVKSNVLQINNQDGNINKIIPIEKSSNTISNDWGYISVEQDKIIGSAIQKGSSYTNYYGGEGWYDGQSGPLTDKVVSFNLFAKAKNDGKHLWLYEKPSTFIINATITINSNQVCFVESRNPKFKLTKDGRADPSIFKNLYMVSLDLQTGSVNWEKAIKNAPGVTTYFMAGSENRNVILASNAGKYYIYNYSAKTGDLMWEKIQTWYSGDHGGHFSRPAIVKNKLIIKPIIYKLDTGEKLEMEVPKVGHGCSSYALSEQSIFYRGGSVTQFNFDTNKFSSWERLRPDCWISTIPAQGLVLSPEAGGGCSCGNWLETSMVFSPKSRAPISFLYGDDKFVDSLAIEIKAKDNTNKMVFYTLDGSEPTNKSRRYTKPIIITEDAVLKAVIYVKKNRQLASFIRTKKFIRARPEPSIVESPQLIDGKWMFFIERIGKSGTIHYTIDGTTPTINSSKFVHPVIFSKKVVVKAKTFWKNKSKEFESKETSFQMQIPILRASVKANVKPGIVRKYYKEYKRTEGLPKLNEIKPKKTATVHKIEGDSFEGDKLFALRFEGFINIPVDGVYTFSSQTKENYCFVSFHNKMELENKGNSEISKKIPLKKGLHPITVDYYVAEGVASFDLQVEGPKMLKGTIPSNLLLH